MEKPAQNFQNCPQCGILHPMEKNGFQRGRNPPTKDEEIKTRIAHEENQLENCLYFQQLNRKFQRVKDATIEIHKGKRSPDEVDTHYAALERIQIGLEELELRIQPEKDPGIHTDSSKKKIESNLAHMIRQAQSDTPLKKT